MRIKLSITFISLATWEIVSCLSCSFVPTKELKNSRLGILSGDHEDLLYNSDGPSTIVVVLDSEPVWNYTPSGCCIITHSIRPKF